MDIKQSIGYSMDLKRTLKYIWGRDRILQVELSIQKS